MRPDEEYLLAAVEEVLRCELDGDLGQRTVHDARGATSLRVDVAFETPGIAVELTSLQDPAWVAAAAEVVKLGSRLTAFARLHKLGGWTLGLVASCDLKRLEEAVKPLMVNRESFAPMQYHSRELAAERGTS